MITKEEAEWLTHRLHSDACPHCDLIRRLLQGEEVEQ